MTFDSWVIGWRDAIKLGHFEQQRFMCENQDILVTHKTATFKNGSGEAILQSIFKMYGLLWRGEIGATPLPSK